MGLSTRLCWSVDRSDVEPSLIIEQKANDSEE